MNRQAMTMAALVAVMASPAMAGYSILQGSSAPTYTTTLTFDEPGTPLGIVSANYWQPGWGVTIEAGDGQPIVTDEEPGWGLGDGNKYFGNFGVFMTFDNDLSALSMEIWDPSGPPSPFGGGLGVYLFNDGVEVASFFGEPAWGGLGDPAFDITTDGGSVFDEVRVLGFGFLPTTYADNISWNVVPAPGSLALLLAADVIGRRRRR